MSQSDSSFRAFLRGLVAEVENVVPGALIYRLLLTTYVPSTRF